MSNKNITLHTYPFEYYGWIPSYRDFDTDWITIQAESEAQAWKQFYAEVPFVKSAGINAVDGKPYTETQIQNA
jgi:hypothetical protein